MKEWREPFLAFYGLYPQPHVIRIPLSIPVQVLFQKLHRTVPDGFPLCFLRDGIKRRGNEHVDPVLHAVFSHQLRHSVKKHRIAHLKASLLQKGSVFADGREVEGNLIGISLFRKRLCQRLMNQPVISISAEVNYQLSKANGLPASSTSYHLALRQEALPTISTGVNSGSPCPIYFFMLFGLILLPIYFLLH